MLILLSRELGSSLLTTQQPRDQHKSFEVSIRKRMEKRMKEEEKREGKRRRKRGRDRLPISGSILSHHHHPARETPCPGPA